MKKLPSLLCILCSFLANHSYSATCGAYLGGGAGYGYIKTPNKNAFVGTPNQSNSFGGWGGRIFAGWNFTNYLGLEGGLARYPRSRYSAVSGGASTSLRYYARTADIVLKGYLPVGMSPLNLYALAGAASYWETIKLANAAFQGTFDIPNPVTTHQRRTRPIYGVGILLNPWRHFTTNVEFTWIQSLGNFGTNHLAVPTTTLATWNFAYNF